MEQRRELGLARKQLDKYHRNIGENVLWAAYNPDLTVENSLYNEPGLRAYFTPVYVQTLWVNVSEANKRLDDERYDVRNKLSLAVSVEALRNAGVPHVLNDKTRIFDLFSYWSRAWSVVDYEILGRAQQGDSSTIGITAVEVDVAGDYPFEYPMWVLDTLSNEEMASLTFQGTTASVPSLVGLQPKNVGRWAALGTVRIVAGQERAVMAANGTLDYVQLTLGIAPTTGRQCVIDIIKNNTTSIFASPGSRPTLVTGANTIKVTPDVRSFLVDDYYTASVVQSGGAEITIDLVAQG